MGFIMTLACLSEEQYENLKIETIILLAHIPQDCTKNSLSLLLNISEKQFKQLFNYLKLNDIIIIKDEDTLCLNKAVLSKTSVAKVCCNYNSATIGSIVHTIMLLYEKEFYLLFENINNFFNNNLLIKNVVYSKLTSEIFIDVLCKVKVPLSDENIIQNFITICNYVLDKVSHVPWHIPSTLKLYYKIRSIEFARGNKEALAQLDISIGSLNISRVFYSNQAKLHDIMREGVKKIASFEDMYLTMKAIPELCRFYYFEGDFYGAINLAYLYLEIHNSDLFLQYSSKTYIYAALSAIYLSKLNIAMNILKICLTHLKKKNLEDEINEIISFMALVMIFKGEYEEAHNLLSEILKNNQGAFTYGAISAVRIQAYLLYIQGDIEASYAYFTSQIQAAYEASLIHSGYLAAPFVLELLVAYEEHGLSSPYKHTVDEELAYASSCPAMLLRAMAFRFLAEKHAQQHGWNSIEAGKYLAKSASLLRALNAPMELHKTLDSLCKHHLARDEFAKAKSYAKNIFSICKMHNKIPYPKELDLHFKFSKKDRNTHFYYENLFFQNLSKALLCQFSWWSDSDFYKQFITSLIVAFGAHCGSIFKLEDGKPHLHSSINMKNSLNKENQINMIDKSIKKKKSYLGNFTYEDNAYIPNKTYKIFTLYISVEGDATYILYIESYSPLGISIYNEKFFLKLLELYVASQIKINISIEQHVENKSAPISDIDTSLENTEKLTPVIYKSNVMHKILKNVEIIGKSDAPALILGESGVGKELIARRLHEHSNRKGNFIPVNISSTPEELFESEFYGHEKGSFTGAHSRKIGLFELAHNGTLFIDEVGDIPLTLQVKLLRILQEKQFMRVGGVEFLKSDFRLVTATNVEMETAINESRFRRDLFYRINVVPIKIPPLRERPEDILCLAKHFAVAFLKKHNMPKRLVIGEEEVAYILQHDWPGNVRELQNYVERCCIIPSKGGLLTPILPHYKENKQADSTKTDEIHSNNSFLVHKDVEKRIDTHSHVLEDKTASSHEPEKAPYVEQNFLPAPVETQNLIPETTKAFLSLPTDLSMKEVENAYFEYVYLSKKGVIGGKNGVAVSLSISEQTAFTLVKKLNLRKKYELALIKQH